MRLRAHPEALGTLRPLDSGETLLTPHPGSGERLALHPRREGLPVHPRSRKSAAVMAATATTAAAAYERGLAAAAAVLTMRSCSCRGCDRQRGDARCEKHPGHDSVSFRTIRTARSSRRSNH
jgi:hypothetical protein